MTAPSPPVRAVAQVTRQRPATSAPAEVPRLRRRPSHLGGLHLLQLLLIEAALVGTLAAATRSTVAVVAAGIAGAAIVAVVLARHDGRWWLERRLLSLAQQRRRRSRPARHSDPRVTALRHLAPGLTVGNAVISDSFEAGVARDDAGWYAGAAVTMARQRNATDRGLPLDQLVEALADTGQPGAVLQIVTLTVPAPGMDTPPASHAGQSYRQLLTGFDSALVPAYRTVWVTVRLDAWALAEAVVDEHGTALDDVPGLVAALLRRVTRALRRAGFTAQPLDADGLLDALVLSCDLAPPPPGQTGTDPREEWSRWHSSRLAHRTFWVRQWPATDQIGALLDAAGAASSAMSSVALILTPDADGDNVDLRGLVRVAAPPADLNPLCIEVDRAAAQAGAELFPLDGEHSPAAYASAPTGGGAR